MNLRMIGLAGAAVLAWPAPLVAFADPAVVPDAVSGEPASSSDAQSPGDSPGNARIGVPDGLSGKEPSAFSPTSLKSPSGMSAETAFPPAFDLSPASDGHDHGYGRGGTPAIDGRDGVRRPDAVIRCGPELVAPEGVEAQTCVLARGGETWARLYYRNTTGEELRSVLTLMGPGGRTVELRCEPATHDEPGICETPRVPSSGAPRSATAVAEFVGAGPVDEAPLLLRAGSERPSPAAG